MNKATKLVGDRVRISKGSRWYGKDDAYNPIYVTGTVSAAWRHDLSGEYCYDVEWDNGKKNGYREGDLYLYRGDNKFERKKQEKLIVTKEFLLAAYNAACADWKQRLEGGIPRSVRDRQVSHAR